MGVSSVEVIGSRAKVQKALALNEEIPLISVLANPTNQRYCRSNKSQPQQYKSCGSVACLWAKDSSLARPLRGGGSTSVSQPCGIRRRSAPLRSSGTEIRGWRGLL